MDKDNQHDSVIIQWQDNSTQFEDRTANVTSQTPQHEYWVFLWDRLIYRNIYVSHITNG